ncbi:serine-rich adhesin for platelets [Paralichthys olivaceus]|uniref:serine-rich adhesin for platelets n=1 Tax=Paralichthys olivaceus TaxID=8255 RepID=UPI0037514D4C
MDLSFLPTPVSECDTRTGAQFTVRSASSPSYSFTRRPGVRRSRGFTEEVREGTEGEGERERHGTDPYTNGTNKEEDGVIKYQDSTGGHSSVKGQPEGKETLGHETSPKLNQNGAGVKMSTESSTDPAFEGLGRTALRRYNLSSRSRSLDWGAEESSPFGGTRADMLSTNRGGDVTKQPGGLDESQTGAEAVRSRVMFSTHSYSSAGRTNVVQVRNPVSHLGQTLVRVSRGHSLPSRLRSESGPSSRFTETASSLGPKGGQSILERIEKLYGSAGFTKAEDHSKIRDFSTSATSADSFMSSHRSYERVAGGTFPRRFSLGEKNSLSPMQSFRSVTSTPQRDVSGSESSLSPGRSRRLSGGLWHGQVQDRYPLESGAKWGKGLVDIGTKSLDRARSRNTVAAQIRSARAAAGFISPNHFLEEETSAALKDSSRFIEGGIKDQGWVNDGKETNGVYGAKEKTELKSSITDDVFESSPNKTTPKKNFSAAASVRNKINQFEALTQRATENILMPRRAFSVPTQLNRGYDDVKKSMSAKAIGGLRDKWEDLKEGGEAHKPDEKGTGAGKRLLLERFLSADGIGLERTEKGWDDMAESERKETHSQEKFSEDFGKYLKLKSSLEIPLNGGHGKTFFFDETDFAKVSSPKEASEKDMTDNNTPTLLLSNFNDTSTNVPSSPVSDDDKTPTNTPNHSPVDSPTAELEKASPIANRDDSTCAAKTPDPDSSPPPNPLATSSHSNLPDLVSPEITTAKQRGKKQELDLEAWVAGLNSAIKVWNDDGDYEDDDESTQRDEDSNYDSDSDSGESSVTITSNMSQSDHRSFCVSLSELCNFAGVDYESDNDSDEWQSRGRRTASLSSDVSALSCVSVMPSEELDRLLEDVRSLGENTLQDYDDVQVAVLHKEVGVGLGFSVAGGVDQSKPVTVHRVFHSGVAAKEGSIMEGDQVLSINGTALSDYNHWEVLRVLRRAKSRETGVVVLRRGGVTDISKSGVQTSTPGPTQTQFTDAGQHMCVCLEKNSRDLGFSLEGGVGSSLGNRPLIVQKIFQGGPVNKVCPGDEILEIEGVSVVGMRRLEAWTLIRKLPPGPVDVVLSRPLKHLET